MNKPCIIFDIDGTIANCDHRKHFVEFNFEEFENRCGEDTPYEDVLWIMKRLFQSNRPHDMLSHVDIFLCSGRQEKYRAKTEKWLQDNDAHYHELFMRPTGDCRKDSIVKSQMLDHIQQTHKVMMVFDDRQQVVDMWRERGITCSQVREWVEGVRQKYSPGHLTLTVGPSGAGKSTFINQMANDDPNYLRDFPNVISTDHLRQQLCGNFVDQSKNDQVFAALHAIVKARIEHGLDTTVDATNLRNKDRLALVDLVPDTPTRYMVIDRPLEEKLKTRNWRTEELVRRHDQLFKSNLKYILNGDGRSNVVVHDKRTYK